MILIVLQQFTALSMTVIINTICIAISVFILHNTVTVLISVACVA